MNPDLSAANCVGTTPAEQKRLQHIFESTEADDHRQAVTLCDTCPALATCRTIVPPAVEFPAGTWAGRLYVNGRRYPRKGDTRPVAKSAECTICGIEFTPNASTAKTCGVYCRRVAQSRQRARGRARKAA